MKPILIIDTESTVPTEIIRHVMENNAPKIVVNNHEVKNLLREQILNEPEPIVFSSCYHDDVPVFYEKPKSKYHK